MISEKNWPKFRKLSVTYRYYAAFGLFKVFSKIEKVSKSQMFIMGKKDYQNTQETYRRLSYYWGLTKDLQETRKLLSHDPTKPNSVQEIMRLAAQRQEIKSFSRVVVVSRDSRERSSKTQLCFASSEKKWQHFF